MTQSLSEFKSSLASFKEKIKKVVKMCESTDFKQVDALEILTDSLINVVDIKSLNAKIQLETESAREECLSEVHKAEEQNLNYQNYIYQKDTILNQISLCNSYQTPEINRIFPNLKEKNIKVNIDMLKQELTNRKTLNDKYQALMEEKKDNLSLLEQNQSFVKSLPQYLKNLETSTLQAQKLFNVNISEKKRNEKLALQLPQPLYVLYYSFLSISNINDTAVKIIGEEKEIESFLLEYPNESEIQFTQDLIDINSKEEGEQSDEGEITIKNTNNSKINSRHSPNLTHSMIKKKKLKLHPLIIELSFSNDFKIHFSYLPIANIVCMETKAKGYSNEEVLSCIFPFKECYFSSLINERLPELLLSQSSSPSPSLSSVNGILFYEYIQILSNNTAYNLHSLLSLCDIDEDIKKDIIAYDSNKNKISITMITIDAFIKELLLRIKVLPILKDQVTSLMNKNEFSPSVNKMISTSFKAKISHFEEITQEDYNSKFTNESNMINDDENKKINYITVFGYDEDGNLFKEIKVKHNKFYNENEAKYYLIEIKRKNIIMKAKVELGFDYPRYYPQIRLFIDSSDKIPKVLDNMIGIIEMNNNQSPVEIENEFIKIEKEIEDIMNNSNQLKLQQHKTQAFNRTDELQPYMFSIQIIKLLACVDTIVEISKTDKPMYNNILRSKSKFIPIVQSHNEVLFKY